jgi:hypothetical protein
MLTALTFIKNASLMALFVVTLLWTVADVQLPVVLYAASVVFLLTWATSQMLRRGGTKRAGQP